MSNYWLCCWSLEQWDRHLPSECGCLSYERMQSCQQTPTLKTNLLPPSWGSLSVGWMRGRVTQVTRKAVSWKQGKGMGSQDMAWANTDFLFLIGQLPCYLPISLFCILTLLTDHTDGHSMFLCNDGMNLKDYIVSTKMTVLWKTLKLT